MPYAQSLTDYEVLKNYGHSPAKAAEIILDAKRGDKFSTKWITLVRQMTSERKDPEE